MSDCLRCGACSGCASEEERITLARRVANASQEPVRSAILWTLGDAIDGEHPIGKALLALSKENPNV